MLKIFWTLRKEQKIKSLRLTHFLQYGIVMVPVSVAIAGLQCLCLFKNVGLEVAVV